MKSAANEVGAARGRREQPARGKALRLARHGVHTGVDHTQGEKRGAIRGDDVLRADARFRATDAIDERDGDTVGILLERGELGVEAKRGERRLLGVCAEHGLEMTSVAYDPGAYDCVVVVTDHPEIDYDKLVDDASLVVDLRNATGAKGTASDKVFKL